jgi:hypothetical protein
MTNFKQTLLDALMVDHTEGLRRRGAALSAMLNLSPTDGRIIAEAMDTALIGSITAMGDAIDSLSPRIQGDGMAAILDRIPAELTQINNMVTLIVLGMSSPTLGCDCISCKQKKILGKGCDAVEAAVAEALGSE